MKAALTRFARNRNLPGELEDFRYKLIQARVVNGFSPDEASARFEARGFTGVDVAALESGRTKTPNDWRFLKQAAEVYAVSVDWLIGLSHHMERDAVTAQQFALLRGTEDAVRGALSLFIDASADAARNAQLQPGEVARMIAAVDEHLKRFDKFSALDAFEDMPGGAPVVATVKRLAQCVGPLRRVHGQFAEAGKAFELIRAGKLKPIPYLVERFEHQASEAE
ncbi:hypothetical protein PQQ99_09725 [Paraburkholderia sediminicola]|uniref:hypothetical protein n=1 Tax=Paraburkholderia sediminicola TaxID=458836 RepID=UPI0038BAE978